MDDKQFWIMIWKYVLIGFMSFSGLIVSCTAYETQTLKNMVEKGANPIEARCAIGSGSQTLCELYFASKK